MARSGQQASTANRVAALAALGLLAGAVHADVNLTDLEANTAAQQTAVKDGWQGPVALG